MRHSATPTYALGVVSLGDDGDAVSVAWPVDERALGGEATRDDETGRFAGGGMDSSARQLELDEDTQGSEKYSGGGSKRFRDGIRHGDMDQGDGIVNTLAR